MNPSTHEPVAKPDPASWSPPSRRRRRTSATSKRASGLPTPTARIVAGGLALSPRSEHRIQSPRRAREPGCARAVLRGRAGVQHPTGGGASHRPGEPQPESPPTTGMDRLVGDIDTPGHSRPHADTLGVPDLLLDHHGLPSGAADQSPVGLSRSPDGMSNGQRGDAPQESWLVESIKSPHAQPSPALAVTRRWSVVVVLVSVAGRVAGLRRAPRDMGELGRRAVGIAVFAAALWATEAIPLFPAWLSIVGLDVLLLSGGAAGWRARATSAPSSSSRSRRARSSCSKVGSC